MKSEALSLVDSSCPARISTTELGPAQNEREVTVMFAHLPLSVILEALFLLPASGFLIAGILMRLGFGSSCWVDRKIIQIGLSALFGLLYVGSLIE